MVPNTYKLTNVILLAMAVLGGVFIAIQIKSPQGVIVIIQRRADLNPSPLFWALQYGVPDDEFEELVVKYPSWTDYRFPVSGWNALTDCIEAKRTNCALALMKHGANLEKTLQEEKRQNNN